MGSDVFVGDALQDVVSDYHIAWDYLFALVFEFVLNVLCELVAFLVLWGFGRDEEKLALRYVGPVHSFEERMALQLAQSVCS